MPLRLILEHRSDRNTAYLRQELEDIKAKLDILQHSYNRLTLQYGAEVQYNAALIDLLRTHNIKFNQIFDHGVRYGDRRDD